MSALPLRERIEAALRDGDVKLGTATLPNKARTPALTVGDWPEGTTVTGLEVIVSRNPRQQSIEAFAFVGFIPSFEVRLINWSGREDLEAASNAIAAAFWPLAEDPALIPASPLNPEQVTLAVHPT